MRERNSAHHVHKQNSDIQHNKRSSIIRSNMKLA